MPKFQITRAISTHGCYEQGPNGQYRKVPPGGRLREYLIGHGWAATPGSKRKAGRWCVSKIGRTPFFAATLEKAAELAATKL